MVKLQKGVNLKKTVRKPNKCNVTIPKALLIKK